MEEKSVEALVERTSVTEKMVDFLHTKKMEESRKRKMESPWESVSERMWEVDRLRESLDQRACDLKERERNFFMFEERRNRELAREEEELSLQRARFLDEVRMREDELDLRVAAVYERAERLEKAEAGVRDIRRRASERLKRIEAEGESLRLDRESLTDKEKKVDVIIEALDGRISAVEKKEEDFNLLQERKNREMALKEENLDNKWEELAKQVKLADEKFKEHRFMERIELAENKLDGVRAKMDERFEVITCRDNAWLESLALSVKEADLIRESVEKKLEELEKMRMEFNSFQEEKNGELASKEKLLEIMGEELVKDVKLMNEQLIQREESGHRLLERLGLANDHVEGLRRSVNKRFEEVGLKLGELASKEQLLEVRSKEVFRDAKLRNEELKEREKLGRQLLERLVLAKDIVEGMNTKVHERYKEINMKETELDSLSDWVEKKMDEADLEARGFEEREQRIAEKEARMISKETELQEKEARLISKETEFQEKEARLISKETELQEKEARLISKETELPEKEAHLISKETELQEKKKYFRVWKKELEDKETELQGKKKNFRVWQKEHEDKETELQEKKKYFRVWQKELEDKQKEVEERFKKVNMKETELDSLSDWVERKMEEADLKAREVKEREQRIAEKEDHLISKETKHQEKEAHLISKETELQEKEKYICVWQKEIEDKQKEVDSAQELNEQKLKKLDSREKNLNSVREFIRNCFKEHRAIKKKLLTEKDLVEKNANDLVLREQHLNLALEDIELREKQIKDTVKLLELKEQHSTNVFNAPLEIKTDESADLKFTVRMDGKTLQMFLNDAEKDMESMGDEILKVLHLSSDPAKLVLDAMVGFYPPHLRKEDVEFNVRRTCITLLEKLIKMSPKIKTNVREEAIAVATSWKSKMRGSGENGRSIEVLGFLFLLSAFDIVSYFEEDEISSFVMMVVDQHREVFELYCVLGSAMTS